MAVSSRLRQRLRSRSRIAQIRSSSALSSASGRPANSATTSAVRSSAVGPRPPLVTTRSSPAMKRSASSMSSRRSATTTISATSTPCSRRRSDSHGPLRSEMIPDSTSVPVMRMPRPHVQVGLRASDSSRGRLPGRTS